METILVTGAAGFIGSHVCDALLEKNYRVVGVDDFNDYYDPQRKERNIASAVKNKNFTLCREDIRNRSGMEHIFRQHAPAKVVHLAARAGVRASLQDPQLYFSVNVDGTRCLLELSEKYSIKQFIFGSSSSVYGANTKVPFAESDPLTKTLSPYAESKAQAELLCRQFHQKHKLPVVCLRFFTVYGPRGRPDMAPYRFAKAILEGKPIEQFGDGASKRDYTYVGDIVEGILSVFKKEIPFAIINLGNSHPVSLRDFIGAIEKIAGKKAMIKKLPPQPGDVPITFADISLAQKLLGFKPTMSVEQGMKRTVAWLQNGE
ncbi:GDP-mannose 4,6-dehydratase [Candidatus Woesearchaeota archaeon]|nr:GDP-mannose 4,6-dehydratase [Candidatus Woesearchaeota archaeon]